MYRRVIDSISPPRNLDDIDFFNDLVGFLQSADGPLLCNKWIVFGNSGSGAALHFDYFLTSFWNAVVEGSKFWLLMRPNVVEDVLFPEPRALGRVMAMPNWRFWTQIHPHIDAVLHSENETENGSLIVS